MKDLLYKNKQGRLSSEENTELDEILRFNHVLSLLKTRARAKLMNQ